MNGVSQSNEFARTPFTISASNCRQVQSLVRLLPANTQLLFSSIIIIFVIVVIIVVIIVIIVVIIFVVVMIYAIVVVIILLVSYKLPQ